MRAGLQWQWRGGGDDGEGGGNSGLGGQVLWAVEGSVSVKVKARATEVHVVTMTVLARVVIRVEEMMVLVNFERVEDANASVLLLLF